MIPSESIRESTLCCFSALTSQWYCITEGGLLLQQTEGAQQQTGSKSHSRWHVCTLATGLPEQGTDGAVPLASMGMNPTNPSCFSPGLRSSLLYSIWTLSSKLRRPSSRREMFRASGSWRHHYKYEHLLLLKTC